jgi:hypothetical protein
MERGAEAKSSGNGLLFNLYCIHGTSHFTVAADIYVIQFVSIPTSYTKVQVFFKDASETLGF